MDARKVDEHVAVVHVSGVEVEREHGLDVGLEPGRARLKDLDGLGQDVVDSEQLDTLVALRRPAAVEGAHKRLT